MIPGQLNGSERFYLQSLVERIKPEIVIENGTWYGGGSTLFLVKGLCNNQKGVLYTYETHKPFFDVANNFYGHCGNPNNYTPFIKLFNADFNTSMVELDQEIIDKTSIFFMDGGDENEHGHLKLPKEMYPEHSENLGAFKIIEKRIKSGTHVLCHDWLVEGGRGTFIKWYLDNKKWDGWKLLYLETSYGMAHLIKQ